MTTPKNTFEISPSSKLMTQTAVLWAGWSQKGDREVVREAAVKGYVNLVLKFLSERKKLNENDTERWFKDEILIWVEELLSRKQIFKASHILNNINIEPNAEFLKFFIETNDKELRNYLGNHLLKNGSITEEIKLLWLLLESIEKYSNAIPNLIENFQHLSISMIEQLNFDKKYEIGSKLFFHIFDYRLQPFLTPEYSWKCLLQNNNIKLIKAWINIYYSHDPLYITGSGKEKLIDIFKNFDITKDMINLVTNEQLKISNETQTLVLNEFCKFGVFSEYDRKNLPNVLERLVKTGNLENVYKLINSSNSNISLDDFCCLIINYCLKNELYTVLNICTNNFKITEEILQFYKSNYLNLIVDIKYTVQNLNNELILRNNILGVSNFLSNNNLEVYCNSNPIILLALIVFTENFNFMDYETYQLNITNDAAVNIINKLPVFASLFKKNCETEYSNNFTFYDIIKKHTNLDVNSIFNFRFQSIKIPHFNTNNLVKKFGYNKKINFLLYLKQSRPSIASKFFIIEELKCLEPPDRNLVIKKINRIALNYFSCNEITASCIAFLEMIGENTEKLKIHVTSANIIYKSEINSIHDVISLFKNIENYPESISEILEISVIQLIDLNNFKISDVFKNYDIVYKFNTIHKLPLPELLLKTCASNNLWLPFLIYAQIKNYPLEQVKKLVQNFKNTNFLDHISQAVSHDIHIDEQKNILMRDRDSRKYFLSRVGVRKNVETSSQCSDSIQSSLTSQSSFGSTCSSDANSDFSDSDNVDLKATLLQTLIRCHNSTDPPKALLQACKLYRNPLLAILATSYEPDSYLTNWLIWLAVSCEMCDNLVNYESLAVCSNSITEFLKNILKNGFCKTLTDSFRIFLPNNPLRIFVEFIDECVQLHFDCNILIVMLEEFRTKLRFTRSNSVLSDTDHEMTYLNNRIWIQNTAVQMLLYTLEYNFNSLYNQIQFIEILCKVNIKEYLLEDCPNFYNLLGVLNFLFENNCDIKINFTVISNNNNYKQCINDCIKELIRLEKYDVALKIAKIENIPADKIITSKWKSKFGNCNDRFWDDCDASLKNYYVTSENAVNLYLECVEFTNDNLEKYKSLKYAHKWASQFNVSNLYEIERQMWKTYMILEDKYKHFETTQTETTILLYKDMKIELANIPELEQITSKEAQLQLDKIISILLNSGNFWQALRLEKMFGHINLDLQILKLCCSLAEGIILSHQLTTEQRLFLNRGSNRNFSHIKRTYISARLSSLSSSSHSPVNSFLQITDHVDAPVQDTLVIIENLTGRLTSGVEYGQNVLMNYRISVNIEIPYHLVVESVDHLKMLKDALDDDCKNKVEVVHDFMSVNKWSKEKTADFICEELVSTLAYHIQSKTETIKLWDLSLDQEFHFILKLFKENCSILGTKIYSHANSLHESYQVIDENIKISEIALIIELLIRSHDCFTADCNMEGISLILKKCQTITSLLLTLKSWKLIVRLLTGIARYTEMNYVFQILKENDQFEFLLSKGSKKDAGLKVALLEYLKKYCPYNRELYRIVALHFTLFSEVAQLWEKEAQSIIRNLIAISKLEMQNNKLNPDLEKYVLFSNTDGTKICLNKAMVNYTHAAEYHIHGEKLTKAMNAAKQSELIALQMSTLKSLATNGTAICLLNLSNNQITSLLCSELSFEQALILIEAYNYKADWAMILFEQYIIRNHSNYLGSFLKHLMLTDNLVHDISRRFLSLNVNTATSVKNMKDILNRLPSVHTKYRIASELGFMDLVEDLLSGNSLVFLKDTVWKQGYKN